MRGSDAEQPPIPVAVCLAGAIRNFRLASTSLLRHVVQPLQAHVYIAFANQLRPTVGDTASRSVRHTRGAGDAMTAGELLEIFGSALRGSVALRDHDLLPSRVAAWAGPSAANASRGVNYAWTWYLKRWACHRLVVSSTEQYEVVISARPDLVYLQSWRLSRRPAEQAPHDGTSRADGMAGGGMAGGGARAYYRLYIGDDGSCATFGGAQLVSHDFTLGCANDWLHVSTYDTATTVAQAVHHLHSSRGFAPCDSLVNSPTTCCEALWSTWLHRIGVARRSVDLHIEMARILSVSCQACAAAGSVPLAPKGEAATAAAAAAVADSAAGAAVAATADAAAAAAGVSALASAAAERARRRPNRSGLAARNTRYGPRFQAYCSSPEFEWFGDGPILAAVGAGAERVGGSAVARTAAAAATVLAFAQFSPSAALGTNRTLLGCWAYPACTRLVDLTKPLAPCVRRLHLGGHHERVTVTRGYGEEFPFMAPATPTALSLSQGHSARLVPSLALLLPHAVQFYPRAGKHKGGV